MFDIMLVDIPWDYNDRRRIRKDGKTAKRGIGASTMYDCLNLDELLALPIGSLCKKDAHLFMWVTNTHIPDAMKLIEAWRFRYIKQFFYWIKVCKNDPTKLFFGNGHYTKSCLESLIFARRGKKIQHSRDDITEAQFAVHPRPSFNTETIKKGKILHSAKPACFRFLIDILYPDPNLKKIELFARNCHPGWVATGLEYDGRDIRDFLMEHIADGILNVAKG